jgi:hypothetical protein
MQSPTSPHPPPDYLYEFPSVEQLDAEEVESQSTMAQGGTELNKITRQRRTRVTKLYPGAQSKIITSKSFPIGPKMSRNQIPQTHSILVQTDPIVPVEPIDDE